VPVLADRRAPELAQLAPFVPWSSFVAQLDWRQGEHVTCIGPTGCGKTTLGIALLPMRRYVAALGTKPKDATLARLARQPGWSRSSELPDAGITGQPARVVVWPRYRTLADRDTQRRVMARTLDAAFRRGGWCVFADELAYLDRLGLRPLMLQLWEQGRSVGCSFVGCTQRPAWVPLHAYSEASHVFVWRTTAPDDLRRLGAVSGQVDHAAMRHVIAHLPRHDALYIDTRTGRLCRTRAPRY
jgi:hypothetical protein